MQKDSSHYTLTKARWGVWYYYAYKSDRTRLKRSTGKRTKKAAEAVIRERIADGTHLAVTDTLNLRHMTFAEFSEPFWRWDTCPVVRDRIARGGHYSLDFCDINRNNLERHILPYFGKTPLTEIRQRNVDSWLLALPERDGISASTANKVLTVLRQMLEVAVKEGYIEKSPAYSRLEGVGSLHQGGHREALLGPQGLAPFLHGLLSLGVHRDEAGRDKGAQGLEGARGLHPYRLILG